MLLTDLSAWASRSRITSLNFLLSFCSRFTSLRNAFSDVLTPNGQCELESKGQGACNWVGTIDFGSRGADEIDVSMRSNLLSKFATLASVKSIKTEMEIETRPARIEALAAPDRNIATMLNVAEETARPLHAFGQGSLSIAINRAFLSAARVAGISADNYSRFKQ